MWDMKQKATKCKLIDTDDSAEVTRGERGGGRRVKRVEGVRYMVTGRV